MKNILLKRNKSMDKANDYGLGGSVLFVTFRETWDTVVFFSLKDKVHYLICIVIFMHLYARCI